MKEMDGTDYLTLAMLGAIIITALDQFNLIRFLCS